jgi:RNA polymerase sigma factor (sigma-70 family)
MFKNQRETIGELFERHKGDLLSYLTRRVGREDAFDLLQETFARYMKYSQGDVVADPPPFLQRIAINLARDLSRRRATEARYLDFGDPPVSAPSLDGSPAERLEAVENWRKVRSAVETLPPRCRDVFLLYMQDGLSVAEISGRLRISKNMTQKHMRHALERCWSALDDL